MLMDFPEKSGKSFLFLNYRTKNRVMENQNNEIEKMLRANQDSTIAALEELGCNPVENSDGTVSFQYQGDHFYTQFGQKLVVIWDFEVLTLDVNDERTPDLLESLKYTNGYDLPTFVFTAPNQEGKIIINLEYRFFNEYGENYSKVLNAILNSFFTIRDLWWSTDGDYSFRKGNPSRFKFPEIGYKEGDNSRFDIDYYWEKINGKEIFSEAERSENDKKEYQRESKFYNEGKAIVANPYVELFDIRDKWMDYFRKIGCQPQPIDIYAEMEVWYQGQKFYIGIYEEGINIGNVTNLRIPCDDSLTLYCYRQALDIVYQQISPKFSFGQPVKDGVYEIQSSYVLFLNFNFEDKTQEFRNLQTLKKIMDSFTQARCNLIYHIQRIREEILQSQNQNSQNNET